MSAAAVPLRVPAGGGRKPAPTHREVENHLRATFQNLTRSAAKRVAAQALEVYRHRPEVDPLRWAEADVERRRRLAGMSVVARSGWVYTDPTGNTAARNIDAGVPRGC